MIVPVEKSIGQNSAYRHQLGRALRKRSALRFFAKYAQKHSSQNHLIHSVPPATLPHFVQPVLELKQPPEGIRAEAATPGGYLPRRRLRMRTHPTRHLNIVGAGGNKVTQRRRLETGGSEKPAIHRTIVMIRARPAE